MEFGESYLQENYEKHFKLGVAAKDRGNLLVAKQELSEALSFLKKLVAISTGEVKEKRQERADRLQKVVDSIDPSVQRPKTTNGPTKPADENDKYGGINGYTGGNTDGQSNTAIEGFDGVEQFVTVFSLNDLEFGFEGVIGLEDAKDAITEYVINPIKYKEAYNYKFMDNKAVLLYGPPGTGKTTFAKAVAKETGLPFFLVNMSSIVNCYVGETAKNIDMIFNYMRTYVAQNNTDILVFFDEFDEIAKSRDSGDKTSETAVPALIRNLDGVKKNKGFLVLANTNCMEMLDAAILSRFRQRILIPLPDKNMREKMFALNLRDLEEEYLNAIDFSLAASLTDGLSGRDIAYICDDFKRIISKIKAGLHTSDDLNADLEIIINKKKN